MCVVVVVVVLSVSGVCVSVSICDGLNVRRLCSISGAYDDVVDVVALFLPDGGFDDGAVVAGAGVSDVKYDDDVDDVDDVNVVEADCTIVDSNVDSEADDGGRDR